MEQKILTQRKIAADISGAIRKQIDYNSLKWDLVWIVNGNIKETILTNENRALCYWEKAKLENSTHKMGKLVLLPSKNN